MTIVLHFDLDCYTEHAFIQLADILFHFDDDFFRKNADPQSDVDIHNRR